METTLKKGMSIELECLKKFIELGYYCSLPYGNSCKYDLLVDIQGKIYKIQCKSSSWATDTSEPEVAFKIYTTCQTVNTKTITRHKYEKEDVDFFYTYFNNEHYLIPIEDASGTTFRLRYQYPSNGQKQNIHLAETYQLENILKKYIMEEVNFN